ncbi:hypothetical protein R3P38DRAFT_3577692 [Favolaschia claudopus]|uniref:Transmembrane protein n=1 Tax=Favolaschia claudopus TaxID=2862362 RepID=A0AAW0DQL2_9AGAR
MKLSRLSLEPPHSSAIPTFVRSQIRYMAPLVSTTGLMSSSASSVTAAATAVFSSVTNPAGFDTDAVWAGAAATDQVNSSLLPPPTPSSRYLILNRTPDTGVHDFVIYFAIIMGFILAGCAYTLGKHHFQNRRAGQNDDDEDEETCFGLNVNNRRTSVKRIYSWVVVKDFSAEGIAPPFVHIPSVLGNSHWLFVHGYVPLFRCLSFAIPSRCKTRKILGASF